MTDIETCDRCGHAYTSRYGRDEEQPDGIEWLCFDCLDKEARRG